MASILIVDDQEATRVVLDAILRVQGHDPTSAHSADAALEILNSTRQDLVLLDVMMPNRSGLELLDQLRHHPTLANLPVIIVTAKDRPEDQAQAFSMGADDYVTKPYDPTTLGHRIQAVLRRSRPLPPLPTVFNLGPLTLDTYARTVTRQGKPLDLTKSEFAVLSYLATNKGRAVSTDELLYSALENPLGKGSIDSLRTTMNTLRRKVEDDPKAPPVLITTVHNYGYQANDL